MIKDGKDKYHKIVLLTSLNELKEVLQSELECVSNRVENNKLVLNVSKTKCIIFGSNHALRSELLQVKLLGVTLDEQLTWLGHTDNTVAIMGRSVSVIRRCAYFLTDHSIRHVIQC